MNRPHQSLSKEAIVKSDTFTKKFLILLATFLLCAILGAALWTNADENMPVTCYKGSSRIGTVTVFDWRTAAATCNTVLYECRGACVGCFRDSDYVADVCIDSTGRTFLR